MDKKVVLVTGASGSMGSQVLKCVMGTGKFKGLVLLRDKASNQKLAKDLKKKYGDDIEVVMGDL